MYHSSSHHGAGVVIFALLLTLAGCSDDTGTNGPAGDAEGDAVDTDYTPRDDTSTTDPGTPPDDTTGEEPGDTSEPPRDTGSDTTDTYEPTDTSDDPGDTTSPGDTSPHRDSGLDARDADDTFAGDTTADTTGDTVPSDTGSEDTVAEDTTAGDTTDTASTDTRSDTISSDTNSPGDTAVDTSDAISCPPPENYSGSCRQIITCCVHNPTGTKCQYSNPCEVPDSLKNDPDWSCDPSLC